MLPIKIETSESRLKFYSAVKQFERDVKKDYDLIDEIFEYLDSNYESYIHATIEQRSDIRKIVSESCYSPASGMTVSIYMGNYMAEILDKYVTEHVIKELKSTGDTTWLTRGLIAISIEDCCVDFRNTITCLAKLYVAAERKGMNPETAFQTIAKISSTKMPRGGESSVSGMMGTIHSYAATDYERTMQ